MKAKQIQTIFLSIENSRQTRKNIVSLKKDGKIIKETNAILDEEVRFYSELYNTSTYNPNIPQYINDTIIEYKLTENEANQCEGLITKKTRQINVKVI